MEWRQKLKSTRMKKQRVNHHGAPLKQTKRMRRLRFIECLRVLVDSHLRS